MNLDFTPLFWMLAILALLAGAGVLSACWFAAAPWWVWVPAGVVGGFCVLLGVMFVYCLAE